MARKGITIDTATARWWTHTGQVWWARMINGRRVDRTEERRIEHALIESYRAGWLDRRDRDRAAEGKDSPT